MAQLCLSTWGCSLLTRRDGHEPKGDESDPDQAGGDREPPERPKGALGSGELNRVAARAGGRAQFGLGPAWPATGPGGVGRDPGRPERSRALPRRAGKRARHRRRDPGRALPEPRADRVRDGGSGGRGRGARSRRRPGRRRSGEGSSLSHHSQSDRLDCQRSFPRRRDQPATPRPGGGGRGAAERRVRHLLVPPLASSQELEVDRLAHDRRLYRAYLLKERLREVFRQPFDDAVLLLDRWLACAIRSSWLPSSKWRGWSSTRWRRSRPHSTSASPTHASRRSTPPRANRSLGLRLPHPDAMIALAMFTRGAVKPTLPGRAA